MKRLANLKRLGFFTRLLDEAPPADRYRFAAEQIVRAEKAGLDSAWIAQHHFHEREGGLPSPFTFLGYVAAQTSRIRLGTGIVTLPLESRSAALNAFPARLRKPSNSPVAPPASTSSTVPRSI